MRGDQLAFFRLLIPFHQAILNLRSCLYGTLPLYWFADVSLLFREQPICLGCVLLLTDLRLWGWGCLALGESAQHLSLLAARPAPRLFMTGGDLRLESALLSLFHLPELAQNLLLLLEFHVLLLEPVDLPLDELLFFGLIPHVPGRVLRRGGRFKVEGFGRGVLEGQAPGHTTEGGIQIGVCLQGVLSVSRGVSTGLGGTLYYNLAEIEWVPQREANLGLGLAHSEIEGLRVDPQRGDPGFDSFLSPIK